MDKQQGEPTSSFPYKGHVDPAHSRVVKFEESNCSLRRLLRDRAAEFAVRFAEVLRERYGDGDPAVPLSYLQYLYLAKKP